MMPHIMTPHFCRLLSTVQGEAAAAINWVLKDGAGRLGRFLFARWGRELDCELKQFRLAGDLLMEAGEAQGLLAY
jgi:hypothetical protein